VGVEVARWTFDPLVSKNAYLNLARLGARPVRYVRDYYGEGNDSELSAGIGTDRFVVEWRIAEERVARLAERGEPEPVPEEHAAAAVVNMGEAAGGAPEPVAADPPAVRLEVPPDILEVRRRAPEEAARWRASTRHAFETLLARGYEVAGFHRGAGARSFYVLTRPAP
jgi:predicted GNAT superfamily acetyltransferase